MPETPYREALILAGGLGTRLKSVVSDRPKPMAEVAGRPFLERLLDQLVAFGYAKAVLCVGYRADDVESRLGRHYGTLALEYSREETPLGTGGALANAAHLTHGEHLLAMNGDSFCRIDFQRFANAHVQFGGDATIAVLHRDDRSRAGAIVLGTDGHIHSFEARPTGSEAGMINAGIYMFRRETLLALPRNRKLSLEEEVFPEVARCGRLFGWRVESAFIDIGTPESYADAQSFFPKE